MKKKSNENKDTFFFSNNIKKTRERQRVLQPLHSKYIQERNFCISILERASSHPRFFDTAEV